MGVRLEQLENVLSEKRWSQADLARRSGLSEHTIGRAVRNKEPLSEDSAKRISRALNRTVEDLRGTPVEYESGNAGEKRIDPGSLREAMAAEGMNPTELATRTGLSVATVSSVLRGLRTPQSRTIEKISRTIGDYGANRYPQAVSDEACGVEVKLRAGQTSTVSYPRADEQIARNSECAGSVKEEQQTHSNPAGSLPVKVEQTDQLQFEEAGSSEQSALEELYAHVWQSRRMMAQLLEHVTAIEKHVGSAIAAVSEGRSETR